MFAILSNFFQKNNVRLFASVPLESCILRKPYLLEREGIRGTGTVTVFAVPYLTPACDVPERNLSVYAVARDYHRYFDLLFQEILPVLRTAFPNEGFAAFADHAPIDEVDAAARAGLGVLGENGLLITDNYSSFVFLGAIYTSARLPVQAKEPLHCEGCGACKRVCPAKGEMPCLSSLTQKKGALTAQEQAFLRKSGTVWGCDLCQDVCPHTVRARRAGTVYTEIPYFYEQPIAFLSLPRLAEMSEEEFTSRAYAWRRRETIERNLNVIEKGEPLC